MRARDGLRDGVPGGHQRRGDMDPHAHPGARQGDWAKGVNVGLGPSMRQFLGGRRAGRKRVQSITLTSMSSVHRQFGGMVDIGVDPARRNNSGSGSHRTWMQDGA